MMKRCIICLSIVPVVMLLSHANASAKGGITASIDPPTIRANMGDRITYTGTITNNSDKPVENIIAYISLANVTPGREAPLDLEDWSANKAIRIAAIPPHGSYKGQWPMNLIDSGSYVAYITVVDKSGTSPLISSMSRLEIKRILRLNPHNILPVAFGEPAVLGLIFLLVDFRRRKWVK
jgi:hypothetical protein